jgi:hypothetical protein
VGQLAMVENDQDQIQVRDVDGLGEVVNSKPEKLDFLTLSRRNTIYVIESI